MPPGIAANAALFQRFQVATGVEHSDVAGGSAAVSVIIYIVYNGWLHFLSLCLSTTLSDNLFVYLYFFS